jgi:hypothetical protein
LIDRLQNLSDEETAVEEDEDDGSRGIPGAAGIAILGVPSSSNRAAAGVGVAVACALGSIIFML